MVVRGGVAKSFHVKPNYCWGWGCDVVGFGLWKLFFGEDCIIINVDDKVPGKILQRSRPDTSQGDYHKKVRK